MCGMRCVCARDSARVRVQVTENGMEEWEATIQLSQSNNIKNNRWFSFDSSGYIFPMNGLMTVAYHIYMTTTVFCVCVFGCRRSACIHTEQSKGRSEEEKITVNCIDTKYNTQEEWECVGLVHSRYRSIVERTSKEIKNNFYQTGFMCVPNTHQSNRRHTKMWSRVHIFGRNSKRI